MAEGDARIRIKLGQVEIEYEGKADFLKTQLLETVKEVLELQKEVPAALAAPLAEQPPAPSNSGKGTIEHSTDTIAYLIGATTGNELAMAAAAHLHFTKGKKTFARKEILQEMKGAHHYFKQSYEGNLSRTLKALTKGKARLRVISTGIYSLSNTEVQELGATFADA